MALGYHGKARMGQRNTAKPPKAKGGTATAVGGPRPDRTAKWPGSPGKKGPKHSHGKLIKTRVAGDY